MGKKKINSVTYIQNKCLRNVTYCKRKRGLIKKAMELSMLCDQSISIVIYDRVKDKMVVYNSTDDFTLETACEKIRSNSNNRGEEFTNDDYNNFAYNQTVSKQEPSNLLYSETGQKIA